MSISAQGVRAVYNGSGSTGPFTLQDNAAQPILFEENSDIVATRYNTSGVGSTLVLTTDYTLTGAGLNTAGSLTLTLSLLVGEKLVIRRATPRSQLLDLSSSDFVSNEDLEEVFDKLTRIDQEDFDRRVLLDQRMTPTLGSLVLPFPEADAFIGWNSAGDGFENKTLTNAFRSGTGAPSDSLGSNGDFYFDTASGTMWGPKASGSWTGTSFSLVGPEGPEGPEGPAGAGNGDVIGPSSVTSGRAAVFSGTSGKLIAEAGGPPYVAGGTDVPITDGGTGQSTASGAFGALKQDATESATGVVEFATTAEVRAAGASDNTVMRVRSIREAAAAVALSDAATVAVDWTAGLFFTLTVTANRAIGNPSNGIPGTHRTIYVVGNDGTDRTITFGNQFLGDVPTITDCDSGRGYLLTISCLTSSHFVVSSKRALG